MGLFLKDAPVRSRVDSLPKMNGHPIIPNMPGASLFKTSSACGVRVRVNRPEGGCADFYVHKNCVGYRGGGYYGDAMYDVMLMDDAYPLYDIRLDRNTGKETMVRRPEPVPIDTLARMMLDTRDARAQRVRKEGRRHSDMADWSINNISDDYLHNEYGDPVL